MLALTGKSVLHTMGGALFRAWMRLIVYLKHMLHRQLGVALRGREAFVSKQFLNGAQIGALFQHVSAKGVAQRVGMNIGREALGDSDLLDDAADTARGQASTTPIDEQSGSVPVFSSQDLQAHREIRSERAGCRTSEWNVAFLFSFAANQDRF